MKRISLISRKEFTKRMYNFTNKSIRKIDTRNFYFTHFLYLFIYSLYLFHPLLFYKESPSFVRGSKEWPHKICTTRLKIFLNSPPSITVIYFHPQHFRIPPPCPFALKLPYDSQLECRTEEIDEAVTHIIRRKHLAPEASHLQICPRTSS